VINLSFFQAALRSDALQRDPDEALKKAVLFPLLELEPPRQCVFFLVDSLDEGGPLTREDGLPKSGTPSRTIGELLANHHHLFPQWLLLVVTARKHTKAAAKLFAGFKKISLDDMRKSQVLRRPNNPPPVLLYCNLRRSFPPCVFYLS